MRIFLFKKIFYFTSSPVRHVIHWGSPPSAELYLQAIGRCGRDGLPSKAIIFSDDSDFARYQGPYPIFYVMRLIFSHFLVLFSSLVVNKTCAP